MKYVLVIGDGMADTYLTELGGKTPLESLALPAFDRVAGGLLGRVQTVPDGLVPGSDTAILSIFGNDPRVCYSGRSVLEAAGMGITLPEGGISLRVNLCAVAGEQPDTVIQSHNGGNISGEEAITLMTDMMADPACAALMQAAGLTIHVTDSFRHIGVAQSRARDLAAMVLTEPHNVLGQPIAQYLPHLKGPCEDAFTKALCADLSALMLASYRALRDHPINRRRMAQGKLPANMIWPWGIATAMHLAPFEAKYHKRGSVISAVPLVWGIAALGGLKTPRVEGANGDLDTNYEGKAQRALDALLIDSDDFAAVHVEAPDEMAHAGSLEKKCKAIENVDARVVAPLLAGLAASGQPYRLMLLSDHPTLLTTRTHDSAPVPYAVFDSRVPAAPRKFCEREALQTPLLSDGTRLMDILFEQA